MTINKRKEKQRRKQKKIHSDEWWKPISSPGELGQKWLYWNPQNSLSGYGLINPITWATIFNWSPYLQLQNTKQNLSDFTITLLFQRKINYTCIGWHSSLEYENRTEKTAKLNNKNKQAKPLLSIWFSLLL